VLRRLAWIISSSSILRDVVNQIIIDDSDHTRRHVDSVDSDDCGKHDDKDNTKINSDKLNEKHNLKDDDCDGIGGNDDVAKKSILYHRYSPTMMELHQIITGGNILFKSSDIINNKNNTDRNNKNGNHDDNNDDDDVNNDDDETLYTCINNINRTGVIILNYLQTCYNNFLFLLQKSQQFEAKITSYTSQLVYNYLDVKEVIINEAMKIKNEYDDMKSNTILDMIFTNEYHYVLIMSLCNNTRNSKDNKRNHIHHNGNNNDFKPTIHNGNNNDDDDKFINLNSYQYNHEDNVMKGIKDNDYIKNRHCDIVLTTDKYSRDNHCDINHSHYELSNNIIDTNNHDIIKSTSDDGIDVNDNNIDYENNIVNYNNNVDYDIDDDDDDDRKSQLFCWCRSNAEDGYEMIECDSCREWFHFNCVGVDSNKLYSINCSGSNDKKMIMKKKMTSKYDNDNNNDNDDQDEKSDYIVSYKATTVYNKRNKVKEEQIEIKKDNDDDENELQYVCISCSVIQGRDYLYRW
jgi:hypothetical protein